MENITDISLRLASHVLLKNAKDSNAVLSPLSIQVLLGMIAAGCSGKTRDDLLSFLKSNSIDDVNTFSSQLVNTVLSDGSSVGGPCLMFVSKVWFDDSTPLKHSFQQVIHNVYKAAANKVDFKTNVTKEVNEWVEKETNGLIKEIIPLRGSVDSLTRLILANALYFKGDWNEKFNVSETKDHAFYLLDGTDVQVPFMTSDKYQYLRAFDSFKVLRLPYKQGEDKHNFSMYIFLPHSKHGLADLVNKVSNEPGFLDRHLPYEKVKVDYFLIPKFKISFGFKACEVLKELGLLSPFSSGGLTEMVDSWVSEELYISSIFHKSCIEVNEEGTEAAAATAAIAGIVSVDRGQNFVANHPFLFLIRESVTGVLLFLGQVLNPKTMEE